MWPFKRLLWVQTHIGKNMDIGLESNVRLLYNLRALENYRVKRLTHTSGNPSCSLVVTN